jgi:hypothetical protein
LQWSGSPAMSSWQLCSTSVWSYGVSCICFLPRVVPVRGCDAGVLVIPFHSLADANRKPLPLKQYGCSVALAHCCVSRSAVGSLHYRVARVVAVFLGSRTGYVLRGATEDRGPESGIELSRVPTARTAEAEAAFGSSEQRRLL